MFDLGRSFIATVERSPRAVAIVDGEERRTYAEWYAGGDGQRAWACQLAGIVVTPLNWRMKSEELDYCLTNAEARAVIFEKVSVRRSNFPE